MPDDLPARHEAAVPRHRLLRDVQPAPRPPRRPAQDADQRPSPRPASRPTEESFEFDAIVYATGFDAMTGAIVGVDITGVDGVTLKDKWDHGPPTYLGLTTVGFPNLFMITGPGSPSVLSNMAVSIEQHVDWIADCLGYLRDHGFERIEPTQTAEDGLGAARQRLRRHHAVPDWPTPGTWAPTCPASRACSCPTSAASTCYRGDLRRGRRAGLPRLRAARPGRPAAQRRRGPPPAARRAGGAHDDGRARPAADRVAVGARRARRS